MPVWLPLSWWPWAIDFTSPNLTSGNLKNEAIKPILVLQNMNIMQEKLPAHSRYSQIIGSFSILYGMWTLWGQDGWHPSCSLLGPQCRTQSVLSEYLSNGWTDGQIDGCRGTQTPDITLGTNVLQPTPPPRENVILYFHPGNQALGVIFFPALDPLPAPSNCFTIKRPGHHKSPRGSPKRMNVYVSIS